MGNKHSARQFEDVELVSQSHEPVALGVDCTPLVLSTATKLRVEHVNKVLSVLDHATGELLFRYDEKFFPEWTEKMLVDGRNQPVVMMEKELSYHKNYLIKSRDAPHKQLYKIESWTRDFILGMKLKLTDATSGEKILVEASGDWRRRKAVFWMTRGNAAGKKSKKHREELGEAICKVTHKDDGYDVEVAAGVDLTIVALFSIILHETETDNPAVPGMGVGLATTFG